MKKGKNLRFLKTLSSKSGQAVTEYILILVVVISLGIVVGGPLSQSIRNLGSSLLGKEGYYGCLTREGLLPGAEYVGEKCQNPQSQLSMALQGLDQITNSSGFGGGERPGGDFGSSGGDSSSGSGNSGSGDGSNNNFGEESSFSVSSSDSSSSRSGSGDLSGAGPGSGEDGGEGFGDDSSSNGTGDFTEGSFNANNSPSPEGSFTVRVKGKKKGDKSKKKAESSTGDFTEPKPGKRRRGGRGGGGDYYENQAYLGELVEQEEPELEEQTSFVVEGNKDLATSASLQGTKNFIEEPKRKPGQINDDEIKGLDLGNFMKILIIAILLVLILVIVGSQVMEYQNQD